MSLPPKEQQRRAGLLSEQVPELEAHAQAQDRLLQQERAAAAHWEQVHREAAQFLHDGRYAKLRMALTAILTPSLHPVRELAVSGTLSEEAIYRMGAGAALRIIDEWASTAPEETA